DVAVELHERARVAQALLALPREQLSLRAVALDGAFAARVQRLSAQLLEPRELLLGGVMDALFFGPRHRAEPTSRPDKVNSCPRAVLSAGSSSRPSPSEWSRRWRRHRAPTASRRRRSCAAWWATSARRGCSSPSS